MEFIVLIISLVFIVSLFIGILRFILNIFKKNPEKSSKKFLWTALVSFVLLIASAFALPSADVTQPAKEKKVTASDSEKEEKKEKKIIPFVYSDDENLEANEKGVFDINVTLGEGYEIKHIKGANLKKSTKDIILVGEIANDKKKKTITVTISNDQETREEKITVMNSKKIIAQIDAKKKAEKEAQQMAKMKEKAVVNAQNITYNHLIKTKDGYKGKDYYIAKAEVFEAYEEDGVTLMLVNMTNNGYGYWGDLVAVVYQGTTEAIADDFIEIYGKLGEQYTYQTKIGGTNSVPTIAASEINVLK